MGERKELAQPGAYVIEGGVRYCVWSPEHENVEAQVQIGGDAFRTIRLAKDEEGFLAGIDPEGRSGDLYRFCVDGKLLPDPASRFQPETLTGLSQVIDPSTFSWKATEWRRPPWKDRVLYEIHLGTFTPEGTFRGAIERLDHLVELGVDTIEIMPVAAFEGKRSWGYDGVMFYAPDRSYGPPDDFRALVDAAHRRGLAVVLDVVYNHIGIPSEYLGAWSARYFHANRQTMWGPAFNWDGPYSAAVRDFFIRNAVYWIEEYRLDGLRLDATHAILDVSPRHIVSEIAESVQSCGAFVIAEDERNDAAVLTGREDGGWGCNAMWSDDFHHSLRKALTGQSDTYFGSYSGSPEELSETLQHGWYYRGQYDRHRKWFRGTPSEHLPLEAFIFCISNHDQVGNRLFGDRLHQAISESAYRAVSMLLCLVPYTPLLFMGQEWACSTPFPFFIDHPGLGNNVVEGRRREFQRSGAALDPAAIDRMPDPQAEATFLSAKLRWEELARMPHQGMLSLYRACLTFRRRQPPGGTFRKNIRVKQLGAVSALRWDWEGESWLLLFGIKEGEKIPLAGGEFTRPRGAGWEWLLGSNQAEFGGDGRAAFDPATQGFYFTGAECALLHSKAH